MCNGEFCEQYYCCCLAKGVLANPLLSLASIQLLQLTIGLEYSTNLILASQIY
jgi:hypothetical protein